MAEGRNYTESEWRSMLLENVEEISRTTYAKLNSDGAVYLSFPLPLTVAADGEGWRVTIDTDALNERILDVVRTYAVEAMTTMLQVGFPDEE